MYICNVCGRPCETIQGLRGHERLKHGITGTKATAEDETEKSVIEETEHIYQKESVEDPRITEMQANLMAGEKEKKRLLEKIAQFKTPLQTPKCKEPLYIEEQKPQIIVIKEENHSSLPIPPFALPPLPEPPEILKKPFKLFEEREMFR